MHCEDNDPTCVIKMISDFRADSSNTDIRKDKARVYGNYPLPPLGFQLPSMSKVSRRVKLDFDDSSDESVVLKKRKASDTADSDSSKLNETSMLASPWETRRMKAELAEAHTHITTLEMRINQMNAVRRETELLFEQEKSSLQSTVERDRNTILELEKRLKKVRKREAEVRDEMTMTREELKHKNYSLEEKCRDLEIENARLRDKLSQIESELEDKCGESGRELKAMECELKGVQEQLRVAKQLAEGLGEELRECRRNLKQWDTEREKLKEATQRIKALEFDQESQLETAALVKQQHIRLKQLPEFEKQIVALREENKNLRQATHSTILLESMVEQLRMQLAGAEGREREAVELRVELSLVRERLAEWEALGTLVVGGKVGAGGAMALRKCLHDMHQREVLLVADKAQLESSLRSLEKTHGDVVGEYELAKKQIARLKTSLEQHANTMRRMRTQNALIAWERNDLRRLVDSCQKEMTMTGASMDRANMELLEKALDGYRQRMEQFEADPSLAIVEPKGDGGAGGISDSRIELLTAERDTLKREKEALGKMCDQLQEQMEYRMLKGDFDIRDVKILHFKNNPIALAESNRNDELLCCQEELAKLHERLALLESGQTTDLTQQVEERVSVVTTKQLEELQEKVKSHERQNQRLREVFKVTSTEFREAVYTLLGYKVDGLPNKVYRLTSLYAETSNDQLLFKMSQHGDMELLETQFSGTLGELIDLHLHQHCSIPAFLSTLTIDLFQRQTMSSSTSAFTS